MFSLRFVIAFKKKAQKIIPMRKERRFLIAHLTIAIEFEEKYIYKIMACTSIIQFFMCKMFYNCFAFVCQVVFSLSFSTYFSLHVITPPAAAAVSIL